MASCNSLPPRAFTIGVCVSDYHFLSIGLLQKEYRANSRASEGPATFIHIFKKTPEAVSYSPTSIDEGRQKIIDRLYSEDESISLKFKCVLSQPNMDEVTYEYVLLHVLECVMFKTASRYLYL